MKKILLKLTPLFLISFALNANEVRQQAQVSVIATRLIERSVLTLAGNTGLVKNAHFSPDGTKVLTVSGNTVKIWNSTNGQLELELVGHTGSVHSAQFSPDSKKIVTASEDGTAKIWDVATGRLLHDLVGHTGRLMSAEFSPDGKKVVTASWDRTARLWNALTGESEGVLTGHLSRVFSAKFSPDSTYVVTASYDGTAKIWDVNSRIPVHDLIGHAFAIKSAEFSHDGNKIVTTSLDSTAKIWNALTGELVRTFVYEYVKSAHFSPDDTQVVIVQGRLQPAQIVDVATGTRVLDLPAGQGVNTARFSPDGTQVVVAYHDATAKIWDVRTGRLLHDLLGHTGRLMSAEFSPDGAKVVTASEDGTARIWNPDALVVGTYFSNPRLRTDGTTEPLSLEQQALLVLLDDISQENNGGEITKADLAVRKKWKPDLRLLENYFKNENNETIEKNALLYYVNRPKKPLYPEIDITVFFNSLPEDVRNALKSVYHLNDDIFGLKRKREETDQ